MREFKDDAWTTVLGIRNDIYKQKLGLNRETEAANTVLLPMLQILEKHKVPVDRVYWEPYMRCIVLARKQKLSISAYMELCEFCEGEPEQTVESSNISFQFRKNGLKIDVDTGEGSCEVKETVEIETIPARKVETRKFTSTCTGLIA